MDQVQTSTHSFKHILPLYAVIFLGFLGYALTITLFIPMLMDVHYPMLPVNASTSVRTILSGVLLAMYPLGQFLGSPIIGNLSDHFGRKKVLLISLVACMFGFLGMGISVATHSIEFLLLSSLFTGICESNMAISQSIIADWFPSVELKTKFMGYAFSACSLGYIVGPLLGGSSGSMLGYASPFWIITVCVFLLIVWLKFCFHDQHVPNQRQPINFLHAITAFKSIFQDKKLYKFYIVNFSIFFAVQGLYRVVPLYVEHQWEPSLHVFSLLIAFVSFMCFIANLSILGQLSKRISTQPLLGILLLVGGAFVFLIVIPEHLNWIWLTFGLAVVPTVMALPICTTWLSQHVSDNSQGQVLGNNQALLVLGESSSAALGGLIAAIFVPLPIAIMGGVLILGGMFVIWDLKRGKKQNHKQNLDK